MSRSSARRAQTEPLAALVAVLVVGVAVSLYAGALPDVRERHDDVAETTLSRVYRNVSHTGVVAPDRFLDATFAGPPGYAVNATLSTDHVELRRGPSPPPGSANASRPVGVDLGDGSVVRGRLSVEVWT
jgi:hypothetical protein